MDLEFEADHAALPALALAFHSIAAAMYLELARTRGAGEWVNKLRDRIRYELATIEPPDGISDDAREVWSEAMQTALDHIFDYVSFEPKADR